MSKILSNANSNAKTKKLLDALGIEGVIQYMAPDKIADSRRRGRRRSVCPFSTPGCRDSCLYTAGRGAMRNVQESRIRKTKDWLKRRTGYVDDMECELVNLVNRAADKQLQPVARLNGTSDVPWESFIDMEGDFPEIQFYDYTKSYRRMKQSLRGEGNWPANYDLTFSYSEDTTTSQLHWILRNGGNVAVVFREEIPKKWLGIKVISGMEHDFRYLDPKGYIVGLLARGRAKHDATGFVVDAW
jgi:hypothetical protein